MYCTLCISVVPWKCTKANSASMTSSVAEFDFDSAAFTKCPSAGKCVLNCQCNGCLPMLQSTGWERASHVSIIHIGFGPPSKLWGECSPPSLVIFHSRSIFHPGRALKFSLKVRGKYSPTFVHLMLYTTKTTLALLHYHNYDSPLVSGNFT